METNGSPVPLTRQQLVLLIVLLLFGPEGVSTARRAIVGGDAAEISHQVGKLVDTVQSYEAQRRELAAEVEHLRADVGQVGLQLGDVERRVRSLESLQPLMADLLKELRATRGGSPP